MSTTVGLQLSTQAPQYRSLLYTAPRIQAFDHTIARYKCLYVGLYMYVCDAMSCLHVCLSVRTHF